MFCVYKWSNIKRKPQKGKLTNPCGNVQLGHPVVCVVDADQDGDVVVVLFTTGCQLQGRRLPALFTEMQVKHITLNDVQLTTTRAMFWIYSL